MEGDDELFSVADAQIFLKRRGIVEVHECRLAFLNDIVFKLNCMPFHNIILLAAKPSERRPPTEGEAATAMIQGSGGLCFTKNVFARHLLETLGFQVTTLAGQMTHPAATHTILLVSNVEHEDDRYLVDVGCGYPAFEAVPLLFVDGEDYESKHYNESFLEFRYIKKAGESLIVRQHRRGDPPRPVVNDSLGRPGETEDGWRRFYDVFLDHANPVEALRKGHHDVCTDVGASPFLSSLRAIRWIEGRMIAVKDSCLILENEAGALERSELHDLDAMRATIQKYFPEISSDCIESALSYWEEHISK